MVILAEEDDRRQCLIGMTTAVLIGAVVKGNESRVWPTDPNVEFSRGRMIFSAVDEAISLIVATGISSDDEKKNNAA